MGDGRACHSGPGSQDLGIRQVPAKATTRCFLACWPEPDITRYLDELSGTFRKQVGGRRVARQNIHITLAFLGDIVPPQRKAVEKLCPAMPEIFTLSVDRVGFFRQGGIVWAGSRAPDPDLVGFVEQLRDSLRLVGFRIDNRKFVPHLTLLRRARKRPRVKFEAVDWAIGGYTLVASELSPDGPHYSVLKRWSTVGDVE